MEEKSLVVIAGVVLILGLIALSILRKHLIEYKQLRLREILHQERLQAMEKDMPLPQLQVDDHQQLAATAVPRRNGPNLSAIMWVRLVSLCLGLFMFFGGIGVSFGFVTSGESSLSQVWTLGFVPALAGIGLLLFYRHSRGFDSEDSGKG